MKKLITLTALAFVFSVPYAVAEDGAQDHSKRPGHKMGGMFAEKDLDKDGAVSKSEFLKAAEKRFSTIDSNGDGKITRDESRAHHKKMKDRRHERKEKRQERRDGAE